MRILLVNNLFPPNLVGGAERSVAFLAEGLAEQGHEVGVATAGIGAWADPTLQPTGAPVVLSLKPLSEANSPLNRSRSFAQRLKWQARAAWNPQLEANFRQKLKEFEPDVVHTNNLAGLSIHIWRVSREQRVPVVHSLRDYYLLCAKMSFYKGGNSCGGQCLDCRLYTLKRRLSGKHVNGLVGNSNDILSRHLKEGYFSRTAHRKVIYSGYKGGWGAIVGTSAGPSVPLVYGYLGQIAPHKGVEELLGAFLKSAQGNASRLVVAGRGDAHYEAYLKSRFASDRIEWLGWCDSSEFFKKISVLVVPSLWYEPLPRVAYEAYAHGKPVLASDRGGTKEIVLEDRTGWVYPAGDPDALARMLCSLASRNLDWAYLGDECLEMAKRFTQVTSAAAYSEMYQTVIDDEKRCRRQPNITNAGGV